MFKECTYTVGYGCYAHTVMNSACEISKQNTVSFSNKMIVHSVWDNNRISQPIITCAKDS